MTMTTIILLVLVLFVLQLFLQETAAWRWDFRAILGNRDRPPALSPTAARLERAKNNMLEALPLFLGLALPALVIQGEHGPATQGALIFLVARVLYVPAYVSGLPVLRSLIWLAGMTGLGFMAWTLT